MIKKIGVLFLFFIIFPNLFSFSLAQEIDDFAGSVEGKFEEGEKKIDELSDKDSRNEYLKKEWEGVLQDSALGKIVLGVSFFFGAFDPLYKIILGVEYSLSFAFVLAVCIWLILFFLIFPLMSSFFSSKLYGFFSSFLVVSLVGIAGTIKSIIDFISTVLENKFFIWVLLALSLIGVFIAIQVGKYFQALFNNLKKSSRDKDVHEAEEIILEESEAFRNAI